MARASKKLQGIPVSRFRKQVGEGKAAPLWLAAGGDPLLMDDVLAAVRDSIEESTRDFNFDLLHGDDLDPGRLAAAIGALPMMAPRRAVVVRHADGLAPTVRTYLASYAENPVESTILLLLFDFTDSPKAWVKELAARGQVVDCSTPRGKALADWIQHTASRLEVQVAPESMGLLTEGREANLIEVYGELLKASLLLEPGETVTLEVLQQVWGIQPEVNIWEFFDRVASGRRLEALRDLELMRETIEKDTGFTVAQVARRWRLAWKERRYDAARIAYARRRWAGNTEWQWRNASSALKSLPAETAERQLDRLLDLDLKRKTRSVQGGAALERLIHDTALQREALRR